MASVDFLHIEPKPVTLHSGGLSQFIIDAGGLFEDERMRGAIIAYWKAYLDRTRKRNRFHFIGIERGGTPWAAKLFEVMSLDTDEHTFNKTTDKIEPADKPSQIVLVDDVLTTGGSLIEVTDKLYDFPTVALVVIDRRWVSSRPSDPLWSDKAELLLSVRSWTRMPLPMES